MSNTPADEKTRSSLPARILAILQLMRIGNVFTAFSNVLMGFIVVQADSGQTTLTTDSIIVLVGLLISTFCLYSAGMVLNDVFDVQRDTAEQRNRPIPAGLISLTTAQKLGWSLLGLGILSGLAAGTQGVIMASAVAVSVVLYDWILKQTPIAPLAMGACRMFNVLLGMSLAQSDAAICMGFAQHHLIIAGSIGLFVAGLTWFARTEARVSNRAMLLFGVLIMISGLVGLAIFPEYTPDPSRLRLAPAAAVLLITSLGALTLYRCLLAVADPVPAKVQAGVIGCLKSLIFLDASVVLIVSGRVLAIGTLSLLIPMLIIGKKIRST